MSIWSSKGAKILSWSERRLNQMHFWKKTEINLILLRLQCVPNVGLYLSIGWNKRFLFISAPCMSNCIDILARDVVAFHFCQLDNEPSCTIPEFVHNLAAQLSRCPNLTNYRTLLSQNSELLSTVTYRNCLENPTRALVKGILEPLAMLRSQGKISGQRSLILVDSLCDAEYHRTDSGETLASFLGSHLQFFPRWLRIICTVRSNMIDIMKPYPFHRLR